MSRRRITMQYYREPEGWWAASEDLPGFSAAGDSFEEVRAQAHTGAEFFACESLEVVDLLPEDLAGEVAETAVSVRPSPLLVAVADTSVYGAIAREVTNYFFFGQTSARLQVPIVHGAKVGSWA